MTRTSLKLTPIKGKDDKSEDSLPSLQSLLLTGTPNRSPQRLCFKSNRRRPCLVQARLRGHPLQGA